MHECKLKNPTKPNGLTNFSTDVIRNLAAKEVFILSYTLNKCALNRITYVTGFAKPVQKSKIFYWSVYNVDIHIVMKL